MPAPACLADHSPRDPLRQEERPARIGVVHPVVALERGIEEIAAIARLHAGVVHHAVEGAERIPHRVDERFVLVDCGDVAADERRPSAAFHDARNRVVDGRVLDDVVDHDVEAASCELQRDAAADAAPPARHERNGSCLSHR